MINLELLKKLIRCKAVSKDVNAVNGAVDCMSDFLQKQGLYCTVEVLDGRKILYASTMPGKVQDILFNAHLDVVPAQDCAFEPEVRDGKLFARGSHDCQGNAVVIAEILCNLAGKVSAGAIFSTDEEIGGDTTAYMVQQGYGAKKIILILDASAYSIAHAQKGIISMTLRAHGRGGHASIPWTLDNPIDRLLDGYLKLRSAWEVLPDDKWGNTMTPCIISGGSAANQVPDTAEMVLNIRYISEDDEQSIISKAGELTGLEVTVNAVSAPAFVDVSHPLMQKLQKAMQKKFKEHTIDFYRMDGATDARHFVKTGVPVAIIGTAGGGCHQAEEWCILQCLEDYADFLKDFAEKL